MSLTAFLGAIELGLLYGLVAIGVHLSFRVLAFPDLTVDGSFPLGAAVAAATISAGHDPFAGTALAVIMGALAGWLTAILAVRFNILHLLASILVMIAAYSVNLRIMGRPNVALLGVDSVLWPIQALGLRDLWGRPLAMALTAAIVTLLVGALLRSDLGLAMRAVGANPRMAEAQGVRTGALIMAGMALSNAVVALAGALFAQANGFADVTIGTGTIVTGLAAVIVGETLFRSRGVIAALVACVVGSVLYRLAIALALEADVLGLQASDLNLVTAVLVGLALILPGGRRALPR